MHKWLRQPVAKSDGDHTPFRLPDPIHVAWQCQCRCRRSTFFSNQDESSALTDADVQSILGASESMMIRDSPEEREAVVPCQCSFFRAAAESCGEGGHAVSFQYET